MSMRTYPIASYGLHVTEEDVQDYADKNDVDATSILEKIAQCFSSFEGELISFGNAPSIDACDEMVYILELSKAPDLFTQAYPNKEAAVQELKESYGKYLPENYDYANRFVEVCGTVFG